MYNIHDIACWQDKTHLRFPDSKIEQTVSSSIAYGVIPMIPYNTLKIYAMFEKQQKKPANFAFIRFFFSKEYQLRNFIVDQHPHWYFNWAMNLKCSQIKVSY